MSQSENNDKVEQSDDSIEEHDNNKPSTSKVNYKIINYFKSFYH